MVLDSDITLKLYNLWSTGPEMLQNGTETRARAYKLGGSNQN